MDVMDLLLDEQITRIRGHGRDLGIRSNDRISAASTVRTGDHIVRAFRRIMRCLTRASCGQGGHPRLGTPPRERTLDTLITDQLRIQPRLTKQIHRMLARTIPANAIPTKPIRIHDPRRRRPSHRRQRPQIRHQLPGKRNHNTTPATQKPQRPKQEKGSGHPLQGDDRNPIRLMPWDIDRPAEDARCHERKHPRKRTPLTETTSRSAAHWALNAMPSSRHLCIRTTPRSLAEVVSR